VVLELQLPHWALLEEMQRWLADEAMVFPSGEPLMPRPRRRAALPLQAACSTCIYCIYAASPCKQLR